MENEIGSFICDFYYRAENIGTSDIKDFMVGLKENTSLTELDFSNNCITDRTALGNGIGEILKVSVISLHGNTFEHPLCQFSFILEIRFSRFCCVLYVRDNERSCA